MSEFMLKTVNEYKNIAEELPPIGKPVEVLCTMITQACLVGTEPKPLWQQVEGSEMETDVKVWRELPEPMPVISEEVPNDVA